MASWVCVNCGSWGQDSTGQCCGHPEFVTMNDLPHEYKKLRAMLHIERAIRSTAGATELARLHSEIDMLRMRLAESYVFVNAAREYLSRLSDTVPVGEVLFLYPRANPEDPLGFELDFTPSATRRPAAMANVGAALLDALAMHVPNYRHMDTPADIVMDLIDERDAALHRLALGQHMGEVYRKKVEELMLLVPHTDEVRRRIEELREIAGVHPVTADGACPVEGA